jgi:hypothetical protein
MAGTTKAPAVNPAQLLEELTTIATQVEADKGSDSGSKALAKSLTVMGEKLTSSKADILKVQPESDDQEEVGQLIDSVIATVNVWAGLVAPSTATELWDADRVSAQLSLLGNMQALGLLSEEDSVALDGVGERLATIRSRRRSPAKPQPTIYGRPAKVLIATEADGTTVAHQTGNTATSVQNLRATAKRFVKKATGQDADDAMVEGITTAVKEVVENGSDEQHFGGLVFTPTD